MTKPSVALTADDERSSNRNNVEIPAGLRTERGRRVPVIIRNVSCFGFMAEGGASLVPGTLATLDLIDGSGLEARIVWKREGHVGGAFVEPISDAVLAAIA